MHTFSLLIMTTMALAASIPDRLGEDDTTPGTPIRRSAEPGNIQLHKTVIPDWADNVYVNPRSNRHQDPELLFCHQGNVVYVPGDRESPAICVDPVDVQMYAETHSSPGVEKDFLFTRRSKSGIQRYGREGRVPTSTRKPGKIHTQRKLSVSYDHGNNYNGMHCGQSVRETLKPFKKCTPTADWTCVRSGEQARGGVTIEFHTPGGCDGRRIQEVMRKATGDQVDVWCQHK